MSKMSKLFGLVTVCIEWLPKFYARLSVRPFSWTLSERHSCSGIHVGLHSNDRISSSIHCLPCNIFFWSRLDSAASRASIPKRQWCIPSISEYLSESMKNIAIALFSKMSVCIHQNIWWPLLVVYSKFVTFPYFRRMYTFLPIAEKLYPFYFFTFLPIFVQFICFLHNLRVFCFPLFSPCMMHLCVVQYTYWTPLCSFMNQWIRHFHHHAYVSSVICCKCKVPVIRMLVALDCLVVKNEPASCK